MLQYVIRRIFMMIPVLFGVSIIVFGIMHLSPGDPAILMLGEGALFRSLDGRLDLHRLRLQLLDPLGVAARLGLMCFLHQRLEALEPPLQGGVLLEHGRSDRLRQLLLLLGDRLVLEGLHLDRRKLSLDLLQLLDDRAELGRYLLLLRIDLGQQRAGDE
jgi:hypothetical protein